MPLTFAPVAGGDELSSGLVALPGILVMFAVNLALFLIESKKASLRRLFSPFRAPGEKNLELW